METVLYLISIIVYASLALIAVWGAFCVILAWRRVSQTRFKNEAEQTRFLEELFTTMETGDYDAAMNHCEGDRRALSQLAWFALANRSIGFPQIRHRVAERFQTDVLSDMEHRLSWVNTVVKSAPMVGLFGTVIGMMGAFNKLSSGQRVDPALMAENIAVALITTACGLAIAIPLVLCTNSIHVRIRKMEELVGAGMSQFLDVLRGSEA